jgi:hypothetical protein
MNKLLQLTAIIILAFILSNCASSSEIILVSDLHYPKELKIITRADWGWQPLSKTLPQHKIDKITIHHGGEFFSEDKDMIQYLKNLQSWSRSEKKHLRNKTDKLSRRY